MFKFIILIVVAIFSCEFIAIKAQSEYSPSAVISFIADKCNDFFSFIGGYFGKFLTLMGEIFEHFTILLWNFWDFVYKLFTTIFENIKYVFENIKYYLSSFFKNIVDIFINIIDFVKVQFLDFITACKNIMDPILEILISPVYFVSGLCEYIKSIEYEKLTMYHFGIGFSILFAIIMAIYAFLSYKASRYPIPMHE